MHSRARLEQPVSGGSYAVCAGQAYLASLASARHDRRLIYDNGGITWLRRQSQVATYLSKQQIGAILIAVPTTLRRAAAAAQAGSRSGGATSDAYENDDYSGERPTGVVSSCSFCARDR